MSEREREVEGTVSQLTGEEEEGGGNMGESLPTEISPQAGQCTCISAGRLVRTLSLHSCVSVCVCVCVRVRARMIEVHVHVHRAIIRAGTHTSTMHRATTSVQSVNTVGVNTRGAASHPKPCRATQRESTQAESRGRQRRMDTCRHMQCTCTYPSDIYTAPACMQASSGITCTCTTDRRGRGGRREKEIEGRGPCIVHCNLTSCRSITES